MVSFPSPAASQVAAKRAADGGLKMRRILVVIGLVDNGFAFIKKTSTFRFHRGGADLFPLAQDGCAHNRVRNGCSSLSLPVVTAPKVARTHCSCPSPLRQICSLSDCTTQGCAHRYADRFLIVVSLPMDTAPSLRKILGAAISVCSYRGNTVFFPIIQDRSAHDDAQDISWSWCHGCWWRRRKLHDLLEGGNSSYAILGVHVLLNTQRKM